MGRGIRGPRRRRPSLRVLSSESRPLRRRAERLLRADRPYSRGQRHFRPEERRRLGGRWRESRDGRRHRRGRHDDLSESVTTYEDMERTARRVFGGTHPIVETIGRHLRHARVALRAREAGERVVFRVRSASLE